MILLISSLFTWVQTVHSFGIVTTLNHDNGTFGTGNHFLNDLTRHLEGGLEGLRLFPESLHARVRKTFGKYRVNPPATHSTLLGTHFEAPRLRIKHVPYSEFF